MSQFCILAASDHNNLALAKQFEEELKKSGHSSEVIDLVSLNLPLYTTLEERTQGVPQKAIELSEKLMKSQALIFTAPEYNGSTPPTFNNAIAWISRSGDHWRNCFFGKFAVIATHSGGAGTSVLTAMRLQLSFIGMNVLGRQILTTKDKPLNTESLTAIVQELLAVSG